MDKITLEQIVAIAAAAATIGGAISFVIKPFLNINRSLVQTTQILEDLQKEISYSIDDRKNLHKQVEDNDKRIDAHDSILTEHRVRIQKLEERK